MQSTVQHRLETESPPSDGLAIEVTQDRGALFLRIRGEAGLVEADGLRRELSRVAEGRPRLVFVDLSGVTFLSGAAMGALLAFKRNVEAGRGRVRMIVPPAIRRVLRAIRLDGPLGLGGQGCAPPDLLPARTRRGYDRPE